MKILSSKLYVKNSDQSLLCLVDFVIVIIKPCVLVCEKYTFDVSKHITIFVLKFLRQIIYAQLHTTKKAV